MYQNHEYTYSMREGSTSTDMKMKMWLAIAQLMVVL